MRFSYFLKKAVFYLFNKPIIIKEAELDYLKILVPGWFEPGHLYCIDYAIKNLNSDKPILEIGTFAGLSTNIILHFLKKYNKNNLLYTTDWYLNNIKDEDKICDLNNARLACDYLKESFIRNVKTFHPKANILSSDLASDDFFAAWDKNEIKNLHGGSFKPKGEISFAYIDGNHAYEFAKRDFENVDKLLISGGFLLFDDSADYTNWGSKKLAKEVAKSGNYTLIRKNPHYFLRKK
ncbi:MAG: class I SAM-dependent methyltransferase [Bacteroidales bacterium]|nr:class I SAM-dependent methyltransferase [Bacteroidales bacterium]MCK9498090.1 class I SAM-dependent methyltransferase [Bacteroidales bacterium]MDY0313580.1 class I SAM-dependent methyltransferase [Bacteroidales bacterium]